MKCKNVRDRVVNVGGKTVGERQNSLRSRLYECRVAQKARMIASAVMSATSLQNSMNFSRPFLGICNPTDNADMNTSNGDQVQTES